MQILTALFAFSATVSALAAQGPVPRGLKIQWIGHSFHMFLPGPVAKLAKEAGIQGHTDVGKDMIGASSPCEHWNRAYPEDKQVGGFSGMGLATGNGGQAVKRNIDSGIPDVVTLASQQANPEPCISKFALKFFEKKKQPGARLMVQETWLPIWPLSATDYPEAGCSAMSCTNRDAATLPVLQKIHTTVESKYRDKMRDQLTDLNKKTAANFTTLVPAWDLVVSLREMVVKGELPGVAKQTGLFRDGLGHPKAPLADGASYLWFAALYGINPTGMKALGNPATAPVLQKLAWNVLQKEPLRGTVVKKG